MVQAAAISTNAVAGCRIQVSITFTVFIAATTITIAAGGTILGCTRTSMDAAIISMMIFGTTFRRRIFIHRLAGICTTALVGIRMAIRAMFMEPGAVTSITNVAGIRILGGTTRVTAIAASTFSWI
jgi:hypothetical protein